MQARPLAGKAAGLIEGELWGILNKCRLLKFLRRLKKKDKRLLF
jgi:hypothetical protein